MCIYGKIMLMKSAESAIHIYLRHSEGSGHGMIYPKISPNDKKRKFQTKKPVFFLGSNGDRILNSRFKVLFW